jgi:L-seryl-tRNA(Ser) seleniumtransferase
LAADRFTLSALEATLELAGDPLTAERAIPLWQLLAASSEALRNRAQRLAPQLGNCTRVARAEVVDGVAHLGPGRLPAQQLRDWCVAVEPTSGPPEQLAEALRAGSPSIWTAMEHGRLVIHLRGVLARDDEQIAAAFNRLGTRTPIVEQRIANPAANGLSATSGATAAQSPRPCHISPNISTREDLPPAE